MRLLQATIFAVSVVMVAAAAANPVTMESGDIVPDEIIAMRRFIGENEYYISGKLNGIPAVWVVDRQLQLYWESRAADGNSVVVNTMTI